MTDKIQKFPALNKRIDTGPVQFGDDWPGIYIRGDSAGGISDRLGHVLKAIAQLREQSISFIGARAAETEIKKVQKLLDSCMIIPKPKKENALKQCQFVIPWAGRCKRISEQDYCEEHRRQKCHCGKQATTGCDSAGSLVCGRPLCDNCQCPTHKY